jgi:hypothetical protein
MSELRQGVGESNEWYTPLFIFEALGVTFDLDPCAPNKDHWTPAAKFYTKEDDGLSQDWNGFVFMNPPFGGRNGHVPWLEKFIEHYNGIAIVRAYTSSAWWHEYIPKCTGVLFPKGKTKFIKPDGTIGGSPSSGVALLACSGYAAEILKQSGLGIYMEQATV